MKKLFTLATLVAAFVFSTNCTKLEPSNINECSGGKVSATINVLANNIPVPDLLVEVRVTDDATGKAIKEFIKTDSNGSIVKDYPCSSSSGVSFNVSASFTQGTTKFSGSKSATAKMNQAVLITVEASAN